MARGLSELQLFILKRASCLKWVCFADILESFFDWPPIIPMERYGETVIREGRTLKVPAEKIGQVIDPTARFFSPEQIGPARYNSGLASLSRASRRLEDRGLVKVMHSVKGKPRIAAVRITDEGRALLTSNGNGADLTDKSDLQVSARP